MSYRIKSQRFRIFFLRDVRERFSLIYLHEMRLASATSEILKTQLILPRHKMALRALSLTVYRLTTSSLTNDNPSDHTINQSKCLRVTTITTHHVFMLINVLFFPFLCFFRFLSIYFFFPFFFFFSFNIIFFFSSWFIFVTFSPLHLLTILKRFTAVSFGEEFFFLRYWQIFNFLRFISRSFSFFHIFNARKLKNSLSL